MSEPKSLDLPIQRLKRKLAAEKNIDEVVKFFFDNFVDAAGFLDAGHATKPPGQLEECINHLASVVWKGAPVMVEYRLIEVPLLQLIHGAVTLNGKPATVVWLTDMTAGVISLTQNTRTGEMLFARLTVTPAKPGAPN
ncbi:MAG: hypothetical protein ACKV2U_03565 [Bryobacteraceae bacterium]